MKMTCGDWTFKVQNNLPKDDAGNYLWDTIERRTYGKLYRSQVAIALKKDQVAMVELALAMSKEKPTK